MALLSHDHYRCVGLRTIHGQEGDAVIYAIHPLCNDCRRREPGHPERQRYLAPSAMTYQGESVCINRIGNDEHIGPMAA